MKLLYSTIPSQLNSRSREGAWIEITATAAYASALRVAPARERGLKYISAPRIIALILVAPARERGLKFSSSEDAYRKDSVAPARERGLK